MRRLLIVYILFGFSLLQAQQQPVPPPVSRPAPQVKPREEKDKADNIFNFQFHYTYVEPGGDLSKRFGEFHNAGAGVLFKSQRNWLISLDASYQFGSKVKDNNIFVNLTNSNGTVMTANGGAAAYSVGQRGFSTFLKAGKLFPVSWRNANSGIAVMAGAGVYYHKINITTTNGTVPTLTDDYKKGYDRLSMGPALTEFVGYYHHSHNRFYNFYIGIDCMQAFTQSVRKFNYDTMLPDTEKRLDLTFGARIGWMIPVYLRSNSGNDEFEFR